MVFLAPMGAHNAIAIEAWQAVAQWDLQTDANSVVQAVRYGAAPGDPEHTQTLANLKTRITTATTTSTTPVGGTPTPTPTPTLTRIANVSGLAQYYRDTGAYGDITPDDGSTATFTPAQPPEAYSCAGGSAVTSPSTNLGLVHDCEALVDNKDTLRGTGTLNWSTDTAIGSWDGVTTGGTPTRVTKVEMDDEDLTGSIPAEIGTLFELTHLDLSDNSLTGDIPRELGWLHNLEEIRLSGNSLTGCIPLALKDVATNDLSSLNLLYCQPPAPGAPTAGTAAETSLALSWTAVANTSKYRVEYREGTVGPWTVDDESITTTSHTVDELLCGRAHQFRVSAYGSGTTYAAAWSDPSEALTATTGACTPPVFGATSYSFSVMEDAALEATVGTVSATDNSMEPVTYAITAGNEDGLFAIGEETGSIAVKADLSGKAGTTATLTVAARDATGGEVTVEVTVQITNTCDSGTAVPNPTANAGLVADCKALLGLQSDLAGTATLNWSADLVMSSWDGISIGDAPRRVIRVNLENSSLGGVIPAALGGLTGLQDLWLDGNQLTGEIPPELGNLTSLYSLYLDQNRLTGEIPPELGNLPVLEDLFLYNNQLTGSIPPEVGSLEELRQLWITNNQFTGVLPGELADLDELSTLRLSGNSFEGCVPSGLRDVGTNDIASLGLEDCPAGSVSVPTGLSASLSEGTFSLTWNAVTGAGLYEAQYTTDAADAESVTWTALEAVTSAAQTYTPAEPPACTVTYRFRVRARGDGMTLVATWGAQSASYVLAANCPPAFTDAPYTFEVAEDAAEDDEVGTLSATDPDENDTVAYAITAGNTGDVFSIDGSTGAITVAAGLDYETTASYTLTVEASDGRGRSATATVTVTVTDVAEDPPVAPENLSVSLAEGVFSLSWDAVDGAAQYEAQHTADATDAETVTWTALAAVTSASQTYTPAEAPTCGVAYRFRVRAYGDGETYAEVWGAESAISSLTPNCSPAFTGAPYTFEVAEDAAVDDEVGTVSASDPDADDTVAYSITAGNDDGHFALDGSTGAITVASALDYESTASYTLTVEASDERGGTATTTVTVTVTDVAEDQPPAPENLSISLAEGVFSLSWDAVDGAAQYEVQHTTDAADAETVTWTALAAITSISQTYTPEETPACGDTYRFRVRAYGDGETYAAVWGTESPVSSLTPNCPPAFTDTAYTFEVAEDAEVDDKVGTISATDPDGDDTVTYSITAGNDDGHFALDVSTGAITVAAALDHETTETYTLTVEASDDHGATATATVTITVTDVAEDPPSAPAQPSVSLFTGAFSLSWDAVDGAAQYEVQYTTDAADAETVTWTALAAVTGTTQTYTPSTPACGDTYRFRVRAYGDGETYAAVWGDTSAATAFAANCPPAFTGAPYTFSVAEDVTFGGEVGTVTATDPNVGDTVVYGILAGSGAFAIGVSTGAITVAGVLDYETTTSYRLRVVAIDPHGQAATTTVEITVTDVIGEGEPELWSGEITAGSFNMARASAFGYTSGLTWGGIASEGSLGTLDDTSFEYGGQTYTVQLAAYFEAVGSRDPYFFIGLKERLLPTDVDMVLYVGNHRLAGWQTTGLGELTTHYYYVANPGFTLESGQVVTLSLRKANPSDDSGLSSLALSAGTLSPAFAVDTTTYTATVANDVATVTVTAEASSDYAMVVVSPEESDDSATEGVEVALVEGANTITVTVTAEDGASKTYTITVTRESS